MVSRRLRIPVADTVLDGNDTEGGGHPVLLLNSLIGTQADWSATRALLADHCRVVTYDERGRGRSAGSKDYSFAGCLESLTAVVGATGARKPILVGWSQGAVLAVRYTAAHPGEITALVLLDGAFPISTLGQAEKQRVRALFKPVSPLTRVLTRPGRAHRMSAAQAARAELELDEICGGLGPYYDLLDCPVAFITAAQAHSFDSQQRVDRLHASLTALIESHANIRLAASVPGTHSYLPFHHADVIATTVNELLRESDAAHDGTGKNTPTAERGIPHDDPIATGEEGC
jgi:pimeloyl-ACP methyl ester carboxylesterase